MQRTTIKERRDSVDGQPQELEVLVHNTYGDKTLLHFDFLGSCDIKQIGHRENTVMQLSSNILKALIEIGGPWLADIERFEAAQHARLEAETRCTGDHGTIEYHESCPVCGWTNEIPF